MNASNFIKNRQICFVNILHKIFDLLGRLVSLQIYVPKMWTINFIITIFKEGEKYTFENCRPISKISIAANFFDLLINDNQLITVVFNEIITNCQDEFVKYK